MKLLTLLGRVGPALTFTLTAPSRPVLTISPRSPGRALPSSPPRDPSRVCTVDSSDPTADAGPALVAAATQCNDGGTVVLAEGETYTIASPTDLTFLRSVDLAVLGTVRFSTDVAYWQEEAFAYAYQDTRLFWRFGGTDVNLFGLGVGVIDGM